MNIKLSPVVLLLTLIAIVLGGVAGYFLPEFMLSISFIGKLFLNSLKILAIPFVITLIIVGVASMGSKGKVKRSLGKTALYFVGTSLTASFVGVILALVIQPGVGALKNGAFIPEELIPHLSTFSFNNLFGNFIPENFLSGSIEMQFFAAVIFAILIGTVLTTVERKNRIVLDFFVSFKEMLSGLMTYILYFAPLGLFSLAGSLFADNWQNTDKLFSSMALFTVTIVFGLSFFALVILPIIARIFSQVSPYNYFTSLIPALSTAFASNSTVASLPVTEECINSTSIDQRASAFILPLGALFNSAGTALFLSASAIFIAQLYGLTITIGQILAVIGGSFFIATMTSFIPYASLFMIALVLQIANFPVHVTAGIGILVLVDFLFGRLRTVVDVWADAVGVAVLGNTFDFKTARSAKAAIPAKRTYKTRTKTTRSSAASKTDSPKTKRTSKSNTASKTASTHKKTKETTKVEIVKTDTKSPFQISPEKNYLSETEKNTDTKTNDSKITAKKPEKQSKATNGKSTKVAKQAQSTPKKETVKKPEPVKNDKVKEKKQRPIIHKIEVPPLPVIPSFKEKQKEVNSTQTDEDTAVSKASAILSQDTIERERAKIAAQLNMMREKEILQPDSDKQTSDESSDTAKVKNPLNTEEDKFTKIDFYSDEKAEDSINPLESPTQETPDDNSKTNSEEVFESKELTPTETNQVEEKNNSLDETVIIKEDTKPKPLEPTQEISSESVISEQKSVTYGRKSLKRSTIKKTEDSGSEYVSEPESAIVEEKEFAVETMTFGRGKKKK